MENIFPAASQSIRNTTRVRKPIILDAGGGREADAVSMLVIIIEYAPPKTANIHLKLLSCTRGAAFRAMATPWCRHDRIVLFSLTLVPCVAVIFSASPREGRHALRPLRQEWRYERSCAPRSSGGSVVRRPRC